LVGDCIEFVRGERRRVGFGGAAGDGVELHQLDFATGSIETLKKIVETNEGITILPMLALKDMSTKQKNNVRYFKAPAPVREIGLVTYRYFVKERLINILNEEILNHIPQEMKTKIKKNIINVREN